MHIYIHTYTHTYIHTYTHEAPDLSLPCSISSHLSLTCQSARSTKNTWNSDSSKLTGSSSLQAVCAMAEVVLAITPAVAPALHSNMSNQQPPE